MIDLWTVFIVVLSIIQIFVTLFAGVLFWWLKKLIMDIKNIEHELADLKSMIPRDYVLKEDYKEVLVRIFEKLDQLSKQLSEQHGANNAYINRENNGSK